MDAVTAFLNSELHDTIFLEQPEGYRDQNNPNCVWQLLKSLYGLEQSPKLWQDDVTAFLVSTGFSQCPIDHCTYIRSEVEQDKFTAVYVHVDDLAITGNDIESFKNEISSHWEMEDLGIAQVVVGIVITRIDQHTYSLTQSTYARTVLKRFNMSDCKSASTPLPPST